MMVATLLEPSLDDLRAAMQALAPFADAYEVRFDAAQEPIDPAAVRTLTTKPLIGTVRRPADGGLYGGSEEDRLRLLERGVQAGFEFIDVEGPVSVPIPEEKLIRSRHEFRATPSLATVLRMADEVQRNGAVFKFAAKVLSFADILTLLAATHKLHAAGRPSAIMGLGDYPRVLGHLVGSRLVYGGGRTNAPGQPALKDLHALHEHWGRPKPSKDLYLVVGDPVEHSLSPRMHNAGFVHDGLDAAYGVLRVPRGLELQMLLERAGDLGLRGLSVTTPLKDAAYEHVAKRTPEADAARAVNAIRFDAGGSLGHETDGIGAVRIVDRLVPAGAPVLVAGTGGAARAIVAALDHHEVVVAGRNVQAFQAVKRVRDVATEPLTVAATHLDDFDLLVNATRVADPFPLDGFTGALFDLRYGVAPTKWEATARQAGLRVAGGRDLLLEQGLAAYEFWTGRPAPRDVMAAALGGAP